jgi:hypothetical protein
MGASRLEGGMWNQLQHTVDKYNVSSCLFTASAPSRSPSLPKRPNVLLHLFQRAELLLHLVLCIRCLLVLLLHPALRPLPDLLGGFLDVCLAVLAVFEIGLQQNDGGLEVGLEVGLIDI